MSYIGTSKIGKMPIGSTGVQKTYLGDELVFNDNPFVPRLPSGYTEVQYIENPSSASINTGISGVSSWTFTAQMVTALTTNSILFGCALDGGHFFGAISSQGNKWGFGQLSGAYSSTVSTAKTKISLQVTSLLAMSATLNGETITRTGTTSVSSNFFFFSHGSISGYQMKGRLYGDVVCVQNDVVVFRGVPCKDPNDYVGLYDLVNNSFIKSQTGVELIAGPELL